MWVSRPSVCEVRHAAIVFVFFFSSRRRHTRLVSDWSSDVCSSDLIKFTDTGGVTIEIEKTREEYDWDWLLFKVTDTGEGIATKYLEEIFESFSQPMPVTTRKHGGTRSEERRVGKECRSRWSRDDKR